MKNTKSKKADSKEIKDHLDNKILPDDVLITKLGGIKVILDKAQRKHVLEFIIAIGGCPEAKAAEENPDKKLRDEVYRKLWYCVYLSPIDIVMRVANELVQNFDEKKLYH